MIQKKWFAGLVILLAIIAISTFITVSHSQTSYSDEISKSNHIVLSEVSKKKIDKAYVICPYADQLSFTKLGFREKDIYSIQNNYQAWETHSGLALKYEDGETEVVYFNPTKIDACPGNPKGSPPEIDPDATIRIDEMTKKFANPDREVAIKVLRI